MKKQLSSKEIVVILMSALIILGTGIIIGWNYGYLGNSLFYINQKPANDITRAYTFIEEYYDGKFDKEKAKTLTLDELTKSLNDPNSFYVTSEEYNVLNDEDKGNLTGIGIIYFFKPSGVSVTAILPNSPAEKANLQPGDKIIAVDNRRVNTFRSSISFRKGLMGEAGDPVALLIVKRDGSKELITLIREHFKIQNVTLAILPGKIAHLKLFQFSNALEKEIAPSLKILKEKKIKHLILDLRNNPGGNTEATFTLADKFIIAGVIGKETFKHEKPVIREATGKAIFSNIKIIILVNGQTASSAELLTAALHDNNLAKVFGEKTYGKGTTGRFFDLSDGSAINLSIGRWYTPKGKNVNGIGITPDVTISDNPSTAEDETLQEAIKALQG